MILSIAYKEWRVLLRSPLTWVALAVIQGVFAWLFLNALDQWLRLQPRIVLQSNPYGVTAWLISQYLPPASNLLLAVSPLLTMRLIADERSGSGIELLLSSPVSPGAIVLGKFLAAFGCMALFILLLGLMPLALLAFTPLDMKALSAALLGLLLLAAACCAIGVYFSSLTRQATVASLGTFGLLFLLWVAAESPAAANQGVLAYLSLAGHLSAFFSGLVTTGDIAYYLLLCTTFLTLCIRRVDNLRVQT